MKNINRIFLFGDSWVEGQGTYETIIDNRFVEPNLPFEEIGNWRQKNSWNKFIKEKTNCEVINFAKQGSDNYTQFAHLNNILNNLTQNDLVLFGLTSKLRDSNKSIKYAFNQYNNSNDYFLHKKNPVFSNISWSKLEIYYDKFGIGKPYTNFKDSVEQKITKDYIEKFFTFIFDEIVYENVAQSNYLFYQEWFKQKKLNIIFFDLFEQYLNPKYINPLYEVNLEMYINYGSITMHEWLMEYEKNNYTEDSKFSVWEWGKIFPKHDEIYHPNQHGYSAYINYLFENFIDNKYNFN